MSYTDLINTDILNGTPKDQRVFSLLIDNQQDLKVKTDNIPVFTELHTDILPSITDNFSLGTEALKFAALNVLNIFGDRIRLKEGTSANLSLYFENDESTGINSPNNGSLDFYSNGYNIFHLDSAAVVISAANNSQIIINNPIDNSKYSLGTSNDELIIQERRLTPATLLKVATTSITFFQKVIVEQGVSFNNFSLNENQDIFSLDHLNSPLVQIQNSQTEIKTDFILSKQDKVNLVFDHYKQESETDTNIKEGDELGVISWRGTINDSKVLDSGLQITAKAESDFSDTNQATSLIIKIKKDGSFEDTLTIGKKSSPSVLVKQSFGITKQLLNVAGTHTEYQILNKSVLKVDTSNGDIILDTLAGGEDSQILFVFKSDPSNNLTIKHNSTSLGQKILTQNQNDFTLGAGYGGVILFCDEGVWKEISIS